MVKLSELRAHFAFFLNADSPLVLFNLAEVGYKFGAWARIAARPGPDDGQFDKTRWSLVMGAGRLVFQKALAEMCGLYWRAPYPDHAKLVDLLAGNYPSFQDLLAN